MIIFGSILTTFKLNIVFRGSWGSIGNRFEPKTEFSLPKSLKRSVERETEREREREREEKKEIK